MKKEERARVMEDRSIYERQTKSYQVSLCNKFKLHFPRAHSSLYQRLQTSNIYMYNPFQTHIGVILVKGKCISSLLETYIYTGCMYKIAKLIPATV